MIKLYHAQLTRSIRIIWLLEELGIPYELATVAFKPPRHSFEQDTPSRQVPGARGRRVSSCSSRARSSST